MGWNRFRGQAELAPIAIDGTEYRFTTIAERNGFQILTCPVDDIPGTTACRKIDSKLRRQANDYISIFFIPGTEHQQWSAPIKTVERRDIVTIEYETADKAIIEVSDTGKGIRKKDMRNVFRPGFTTKKRGWGLGLSLAKRIVEEYHKGRIFVKSSEPGRGTTFRIELRK